MNKKLVISLILSLLLTLAVVSTVALAEEHEPDLVQLRIDNRTDQDVALSITGEGVGYYLPVGPGTYRVFTVPRGSYMHTTFACGESVSGDLDMSRQLELVFTSCYFQPANFGTPSIEKVFLAEGPPSVHWQLEFVGTEE